MPDRRGGRHVAAACSPFLNVIGTVGRLVLLQIVGDVFSGPIDWVLGVVSDYRLPLMVISIVTVAVMAGGELRRGRKEIEGLQELERSTEPDAPPTPNHPDEPDRGDQT